MHTLHDFLVLVFPVYTDRRDHNIVDSAPRCAHRQRNSDFSVKPRWHRIVLLYGPCVFTENINSFE